MLLLDGYFIQEDQQGAQLWYARTWSEQHSNTLCLGRLYSYEEAKKRMYAFSTTTYIGFQAVMDEEMTENFRGLPGVLFVLPDAYLGYTKE